LAELHSLFQTPRGDGLAQRIPIRVLRLTPGQAPTGIGHLRRGRWRPDGRRLTWFEAGASTALFLVTAAACVVVGVAALLPLGDGSPMDGLRQGGRMLGLSS
jgi:hypothetical protein